MTEDIGSFSAYTLDSEGNKTDFEARPPGEDSDDDDDDEQGQQFPPAAGFHNDGSRMWRFVPSADPRRWGDLTYIDQNIAEVKQLGWIEDNPEGSFWTVEEAVQAYEAWAEQATEAYRTVDYGDGEMHVDPYVPVAERQQPEAMEPAAWTAAAYEQGVADAGEVPAAPPVPPPPRGPQWERPADPNLEGTSYDDVMAQLRSQVPENSGRWTAERAAIQEGDTGYYEQSGLAAADRRLGEAVDAHRSPDGTVTPEGYVAMAEAGAEHTRERLAAESARDRYQQTTDWAGSADAAERQRYADENVDDARRTVAEDPASVGVGYSAEVQEYMARSGQQLPAGSQLTAEQLAWLEDARQRDAAAAQQASDAYANSPEGQADRQRYAEEQQRYAETEQRLAASRDAAAQRMQTPTSERLN